MDVTSIGLESSTKQPNKPYTRLPCQFKAKNSI